MWRQVLKNLQGRRLKAVYRGRGSSAGEHAGSGLVADRCQRLRDSRVAGGNARLYAAL